MQSVFSGDKDNFKKLTKTTQVCVSTNDEGTCLKERGFRVLCKEACSVDQTFYAGGTRFVVSDHLDNIRPNRVVSNNKGPITFIDACINLKSIKPKRRKVIEISDLGDKVDSKPSYYMCIAPRKARNSSFSSC